MSVYANVEKTLAKRSSHPILHSYTEKISKANPLSFFHFLEKDYKGKRFFWRNDENKTYIIGLGRVSLFSSDNSDDRFEDVHIKWQKYVKEAVIHNPYQVPGTGPVLFGGFSFDEKSQKDSEWQDFGDALFYVPEIMLTVQGNDYYITVNELSNQGSLEEGKEKVTTVLKMIETFGPLETPTLPEVIHIEELHVNEWMNMVKEVVHLLKTTPVQKVVLARKLLAEFEDEPLVTHLIQQLHYQQPTSYIFAMEAGKSCFLGATPERLVKITNNEVLSTCLAGSAKRGETEEEDEKIGTFLLNDEKNRFEHALVVSMIEDALRLYCENLTIPDTPTLMRKSYIQHLYTPVHGTLKEGYSIFHLVKSLHPTPALGGEPKNEALQVIRNTEKMDRGLYGGPIGWTDYQGNGEFIVGIRSGLIKERRAILYAGCGIVSDSVVEDELMETRVKFRPMLQAIGGKLHE